MAPQCCACAKFTYCKDIFGECDPLPSASKMVRSWNSVVDAIINGTSLPPQKKIVDLRQWPAVTEACAESVFQDKSSVQFITIESLKTALEKAMEEERKLKEQESPTKTDNPPSPSNAQSESTAVGVEDLGSPPASIADEVDHGEL